ncbi:protein piccolo-like [Mytilus californianus]|uniref:protein piccolo-like n=1 Tax=Mytilus californianus TaxID=6549 RepID=UPI002247612C|nr:protein piccolo-like [Mytilus californianus]
MGKFEKKSEKTLQLERKRKKESLVDTIKGGQQNSMATEPGPEKYSNKVPTTKQQVLVSTKQLQNMKKPFEVTQLGPSKSLPAKTGPDKQQGPSKPHAAKTKPDKQRGPSKPRLAKKEPDEQPGPSKPHAAKTEPDKQRGPSKPYQAKTEPDQQPGPSKPRSIKPCYMKQAHVPSFVRQPIATTTKPSPVALPKEPSMSRTDYFRTYMQNRRKSRRFTFKQVLDKRNKRKNDSYNQDKNARGSKALKDKHQDEQYRQNERDIDGKAGKLNRLDEQYRQKERDIDAKARK